ncbi:MAG: hypothetical protein B6244_06715 [Candidatus Cloacimonetes bacterium 4572_55]|nr:MAG: hypothetical protein B6244_06715 [Candidatus Cloacimonetes bacterium 4572_55]
MLKIKNVHPGILIVRFFGGWVLEMKPEASEFVPEDEILKSEKAMQLVDQGKLKLIKSGE